MKKELRHKAKYKSGNTTIEVELPLFIFQEDEIYYFYCAPLDLYGYGKTEPEAKASYEINLKEYLKYTQNKNTLAADLKRLGWKVKQQTKKIPTYIAPEFVDMVSKNEELNRIMTDIPNVRKLNQNVRMPAYA